MDNFPTAESQLELAKSLTDEVFFLPAHTIVRAVLLQFDHVVLQIRFLLSLLVAMVMHLHPLAEEPAMVYVFHQFRVLHERRA